MISNPQFVVYCGSMFSSKSSSLLMSLERYKYQNKTIAAFKPSIDNRYSETEIVSHNGFKHPAISISSGSDIIQYLSKPDTISPAVIAVDEAFMIPGIAETLTWLYKNGFTIIVSSLDISATGQVFHEIEKMLPWATKIEKCCAVCTVCGADAPYTHKKTAGGEEIEIGSNEIYEPRCHSHFLPIHLT